MHVDISTGSQCALLSCDYLYFLFGVWELSLRQRPLIRQPYSWLLVAVSECFGWFGPHLALDVLLLLCTYPALGAQQSNSLSLLFSACAATLVSLVDMV